MTKFLLFSLKFKLIYLIGYLIVLIQPIIYFSYFVQIQDIGRLDNADLLIFDSKYIIELIISTEKTFNTNSLDIIFAGVIHQRIIQLFIAHISTWFQS